MKNYKKNIVALLHNENQNLSEEQHRVLNKIREGVDYAWDNWDKSVTSTFHEGVEKPEQPTTEFIEQWVDNEDFEADGYDVKHLENIF